MKDLRITVQRYYTNRYAIWALGLMFLCVLSFYFYAINQTVYNVVERQKIEQELATLNSEIGRLEFQFIKEKNSIDLALAEELGFSEQEHVTYVTRPSLGRGDIASDRL